MLNPQDISVGESSSRQHTKVQNALFAAFLLALFGVSLTIGVMYNDFPIGFHPDESSKVRQIHVGEFNFFHPQLLLSLTRLASASAGSEDRFEVVEVGRAVSAALGAGAVVALTVAVALLFTRLAAVAGGLLMLQSYPLLTTAHYMKEDTALLLGMSACMAAIAWFWPRPNSLRAAVLGGAVGLAMSGKYIGALMLLVALYAVWCHPQLRPEEKAETGGAVTAGRRGVLLAMAGGAALVVVIFNGSALFQPSAAVYGLGKEVYHSMRGHGGTTADTLHLFYFRRLPQDLGWPVLAAALVGVTLYMRCWCRLNLAQRLFLIVPVGYMVIISLAPLQSARYLLPTVVWLCPLAALGIVWTVGHAAKHFPARAVAAVVVTAVVALPGARLSWNYEQQFANDSRLRLAAWAIEHLDGSARIIQDTYSALDRAIPGEAPFEIVTERPAVLQGGPDELAALGYTHIVTCNLTYRRYYSERVEAKSQYEEKFDLMRARYEDVWENCELLWESTPDPDMGAFTNPELRLYRLPDHSDDTDAETDNADAD